MAETLLDVKNLTCPLPVLRANRILRGMNEGEKLRVLATDRASVADFASFCRETGHALLSSAEENGVFTFVIRARAPRPAPVGEDALGKEESSFSEEKEAKRLLYVRCAVRCGSAPQAQRTKSLFCFFFLQKKEDSSASPRRPIMSRQKLAIVTHEACIAHDPGPHHPESPARLRETLKMLASAEFSGLPRFECTEAAVDALNTAHTKAYVQSILALDGHSRQLDADTFVSPGSVKAAKLAAGGALNAVDLVMSGEFSAAFAAIRPPGHHAERAQAMGFCLFSNAAIAAFYARKKFGIKRIAVADFDVHHGNGTEAIFAGDPNLLYVSSHQSPCYPGTGLVSAGNSVNLPLLPGSGGTEFRAAWAHAGIPALNRFAPELLIISAGFDAHNSDPLAQLRLSDSDFAWITRQLIEIANLHSHGRVVSLLEGGYDLPALVGSIATHLREFTA